MKKHLIEAIEKKRTALDALSTTSLQECEGIMAAIEECKGKMMFCGVGKSAHIEARLTATFAPLGIPSFFVYATESVRKDLGMIEGKDIIILISNSGAAQEVIQVLTPSRSIDCIAMACCANRDSILTKACDLTLIYPKVTEADAYNLTPTSPTTPVLVLDNTIVRAISEKRGFDLSGFHRFYSGGGLGKRLDDRSCI